MLVLIAAIAAAPSWPITSHATTWRPSPARPAPRRPPPPKGTDDGTGRDTGHRSAGRSIRAAIRAWAFSGGEGAGRGEAINLNEAAVTLGSGIGSDVLLTDPTVSRRHLVAEPGPEGVVVRDLGSTNGRSSRARVFRS